MRKYPTNREFVKTIRHNGKNYTLSSIFDTGLPDFDKIINRYYRHKNIDKNVMKLNLLKLNDKLNINDLSIDDLY